MEQMSLFSGQRSRCRLKNRLRDTGQEGEGGMTWGNSTETYTLPYVKQIDSEDLMYDAGNQKLVLCDNLEGWGWEGCGREV